MDMDARAKLGKAVWVVTAGAALAVGLGALNVNVLGLLHLEGFATILRYIVGLSGLASLVMFFTSCNGKC